MDLSPLNYVSANEILADVLKVVQDSSFKLNSRGWYMSQIQQALEELSFDTFFDEQHQVFDIPENLRIDLPKGAFNLRQLYLFNGTQCSIENSVNVYHKSNFINGSSGTGYVARDKYFNVNDAFHTRRAIFDYNTSDPDRPLFFQERERPRNVRYFSIQNGQIFLSENCRGFDRLMMVYNGIMTDIGDVPMIPQFFRQAVKDWVLVPALEMKASDMVGTNQYGHWMNLKTQYDNKLNHPYEGSWIKAERRSKRLNEKVRQDIKEYMSRLNY